MVSVSLEDNLDWYLSGNKLLAVSENLDRAADAALTWVMDGLNVAMNKFNGSGTS